MARRIENLLELDYPRQAADRRQLRRLLRPHRGDRPQFPGVQVVRKSPGGRWRRRTGRCARPTRDRCLLGRELHLVDRCVAHARACLRRSGCRIRLRPVARPRPRRAATRRGSTGYEMKQRAAESQLGSVTGGNGSIYALRRSDYVEVDPRFGHDLSLPYLMVQHGRRAVYEPEAHAFERPTPSRDRVPAQGADVRALLADRVAREDLRRLGPLYLLEIVSHRLLRYAMGSSTSSCSSPRSRSSHGWIYAVVLAAQLGLFARPRVGVGIARYYVLVTWATLVALVNYLRRGVPATWEVAEGTRVNRHWTSRSPARASLSRARCSLLRRWP